MDTALPNCALDPGVGFRNVCSSAPDVALNRYAAPALLLTVSSNGAPTKKLLPEIDTALPKTSVVAGVGLRMVCGKVPLSIVKSNAPSAFVAFFIILIVAASTLVAEIETRKTVINVTTKSRLEIIVFTNT